MIQEFPINPTDAELSNTETYNLLQAIIMFREAYNSLQQTYNKTINADMCALYPLGQIDIFADNTVSAMTAWLNYHATALLNKLPDRVINPSCVSCLASKGARCTLTSAGACSIKPACINYPFITYDRNMITAFMNGQVFNSKLRVTRNMDDTAVRMMYHQLLDGLGIQEDIT